jgi:hypothetical protein
MTWGKLSSLSEGMNFTENPGPFSWSLSMTPSLLTEVNDRLDYHIEGVSGHKDAWNRGRPPGHFAYHLEAIRDEFSTAPPSARPAMHTVTTE